MNPEPVGSSGGPPSNETGQRDPDRMFAELVAVLSATGEAGRRRVARLLAAYDEPEPAAMKGADVVALVDRRKREAR